eukprot:6065026-Alexandrium_andersonii.AAC.1
MALRSNSNKASRRFNQTRRQRRALVQQLAQSPVCSCATPGFGAAPAAFAATPPGVCGGLR